MDNGRSNKSEFLADEQYTGERPGGEKKVPDLAEILQNLYDRENAPLVTTNVAAERIARALRKSLAGADVQTRVIAAGTREIRVADDSVVELRSLRDRRCRLEDGGRSVCFLVREEEKHSIFCRISFADKISEPEELCAVLVTLLPVFEHILRTALLREDLRDTIRVAEQSRKKLALIRGRFRSFFHEAPLPYHVLDDEGRLIEVNDNWLAATGYLPEDVIGASFFELLADADGVLLQEILDEMRKSGEVRSGEFSVRRKNGGYMKVRMVGAISYDEQGEGADSHCVFLDVSGKNRIQELVLQSEKLHNIAGLAAGIAHEINTPLSGILQAAELIELLVDPSRDVNKDAAEQVGIDLERLKHYFETKEIDYFLKGMKQSALRASNIITSLLEFSRPGQDQKKLVNLARLAESAILLVQSDYHLKKKYNVINTKFSLDLGGSGEGGFWLYCSAAEIEQVIFNLLKNGVQAMAEGKADNPRMTIRFDRDGDEMRLEIEDNGPGIASKVSSQVFDPFFTTKNPEDGTGLGLTISKSIITDNHQGRIFIDPECEKGTRFVICLPITEVPKTV